MKIVLPLLLAASLAQATSTNEPMLRAVRLLEDEAEGDEDGVVEDEDEDEEMESEDPEAEPENEEEDKDNEKDEESADKDEKSSDKDKESSDKDEELAPSRRSCELDGGSSKVESSCKAETNTDSGDEIKDEIEFKIETTKRGIKTKVEYEQEIESETAETESETQFEVYFDSIIEFKPASPGQAYDWNTESIVQEMMLDKWSDITPVQDDGTTATFSASNPAGNITFDFTISRANVNEMISANNIKIDFNVADWPWMMDDTYVALLSTVETKREIEVESDNSAIAEGPTARSASDIMIAFSDVADTSAFTPFGQYQWAKQAEAKQDTPESNVTQSNATVAVARSAEISMIEVVATSPEVEPESRTRHRRRMQAEMDEEEESEDEKDEKKDEKDEKDDEKKSESGKQEMEEVQVQSIAFSFVGTAANKASNIYWDPSAGVGYTASADASSAARIFGLGALAIAMIATVF